MIGFLQAHGMDTGPLQRPIAAGCLTGLVAALPAAGILSAFGSFGVLADRVMRQPHPLAALFLLGAFALGGLLYGWLFRRAANDRRGGWLFGMAFGFLLWMAAPVAVLPLMGAGVMAAGRPAVGFFVGFLVWGLVAGLVFPRLHRALHVRMDGGGHKAAFGPSAAALPHKLLRRPDRPWLGA